MKIDYNDEYFSVYKIYDTFIARYKTKLFTGEALYYVADELKSISYFKNGKYLD